MLRRIITEVPRYTYNPNTGMFHADIISQEGNLVDMFGLPPNIFLQTIEAMSDALEEWANITNTAGHNVICQGCSRLHIAT